MAHALALLASRPHSYAELRVKLLRVCARRVKREASLAAAARAAAASSRGAWGGSGAIVASEAPDVVDDAAAPSPDCAAAAASALSELQSRGLLDDSTYAAYHLAQRAAGTRTRSRAHLSAELRAKGVSSGLRAHALEGFSDTAAAARAALKRERVPGGRAASNAALGRALLRAGFPWAAIAPTLAARAEGGVESLTLLQEDAMAAAVAAREAAAAEDAGGAVEEEVGGAGGEHEGPLR